MVCLARGSPLLVSDGFSTSVSVCSPSHLRCLHIKMKVYLYATLSHCAQNKWKSWQVSLSGFGNVSPLHLYSATFGRLVTAY